MRFWMILLCRVSRLFRPSRHNRVPGAPAFSVPLDTIGCPALRDFGSCEGRDVKSSNWQLAIGNQPNRNQIIYHKGHEGSRVPRPFLSLLHIIGCPVLRALVFCEGRDMNAPSLPMFLLPHSAIVPRGPSAEWKRSY